MTVRTIASVLDAWLRNGGRRFGQILITPDAGGFLLRHVDDENRADLADYADAESAREIAHFDEAGQFRPLKSAPTLRRGWRLRAADLSELHRALDYFYPAMLGVWRSHLEGLLTPVPLRATLNRQTGMYAVTKKITDEQAQTLIGDFCRTDRCCLKRILWPLTPGHPVTSLPPEKHSAVAPVDEVPLLCHEACNLLVAQARAVVKKSETPA